MPTSRFRSPRERHAFDVLAALRNTGVTDNATLQSALCDDYGFDATEAATFVHRWLEQNAVTMEG